MNLFEAICDRIFWTFVLLFAFFLAALLCLMDFLFKKKVDRLMAKFFDPNEIEGDIVSNARRWRDEHPVLFWFMQWPLILFTV